MNEGGEKLKIELAALRVNYLRALPGKCADIENIWRQLRRVWDIEQLRTAHRLAHSLTGSGASFGFPLISERARVLERLLKALVQRAHDFDNTEHAAIETALTGLRNAVDQAPVQPAVEPPLPSVSSQVGPTSDAPRRVLLIEDDEATAQEWVVQLRHYGYEPESIGELAALPAALDRVRPAALIVDVMMPDGNGAEAVAGLKASGRKLPPVIFMSSLGDFATRLKAVRAGGVAYFVKPADVGQLVERLDALTSDVQPEPPRIVIVDDEQDMVDYYGAVLRHAGMSVTAVTDPLRAPDVMATANPDLILMDIYMPMCSGLELAVVLRQQQAYMGVTIVFLSTESDSVRQLETMGAGAEGFLTKPVDPARLVSMVSMRVQRARAMRALMTHDSLTGLLNHSTIKDSLERRIAHATRRGAPLAVGLIDIDHFKSINDRYGHPTGDRVLKDAAQLMRRQLRKSDAIGRYGGEEFMVVFVDADTVGAARATEKLRRSFAELTHRGGGEEVFGVTLSAGVVGYRPGVTAAQLTKLADVALYRAKAGGRNRVVVV